MKIRLMTETGTTIYGPCVFHRFNLRQVSKTKPLPEYYRLVVSASVLFSVPLTIGPSFLTI